MLENLRIALRKQKKLVLIFFLTIFLPALTLSVFGVRAIRSERFRLARQEETEALRAAGLIRAHIQAKIESISRALEETAREPALIAKDLAAVQTSAGKRFASEPLAGQTVLLYRGGAASFPLLQILPPKRPTRAARASASLAERIRRAERLEFVDRDYGAAARDLGVAGDGMVLAWMPDGKTILYGKAEDGDQGKVELWRISADGGEPQKAGLTMPRLLAPRVSPDGKHIAFMASEQPAKSEVWVMENFLESGKRGKY